MVGEAPTQSLPAMLSGKDLWSENFPEALADGLACLLMHPMQLHILKAPRTPD